MLAKVGIKGVDSNLATALRTVVILLLAWGIVYCQGGLDKLGLLTRPNLVFLGLSGGTGLSWLRYSGPCSWARWRRWRPSTS